MGAIRQPNAIDFWRGMAMVMIFINHVPGNVFVPLTLRNYAICDAAEVFVFLAGWSISYVAGSPEKPQPLRQVFGRLWKRAGQIYVWQVASTLAAVIMLGAAAWSTDIALFYEWNNVGAAFFDPYRAALGTLLLTYQIGYFNILPLYVVLLMVAPAMVGLFRVHWAALVALSLAVYLYGAVLRVSFPTWPTTDPWYMNPLCWQLLMVAGFCTGQWVKNGPRMATVARALWAPAAVAVIVCAVVAELQLRPDPLDVPEPRALFLFDKTYLSPARIFSLFALVVCFAPLFDLIAHRFSWLRDAACSIGRNSLEVFAASTLLALVGQIARFLADGGVVVDVVIVVGGLVIMHQLARRLEWRTQAA